MSDPYIVQVHHAQRVVDEVDHLLITTGFGQFPRFEGDNWQERAVAEFQKDAVAIVNGMERCLPGGTVDRVFAEMARRRASLWVVPITPAESKKLLCLHGNLPDHCTDETCYLAARHL